jgi:hypothetical protein
MKRWIIPFILIGTLAGCDVLPFLPAPNPPTPTMSNIQMATQVSQVLTAMPTSTALPKGEQSPTSGLPTVAAGTMAASPAAPVVLSPTVTPLPSSTPVLAPTATQTPTLTPLPTTTLTPRPSPTGPAGDPRGSLGAPATYDPMDNAKKWFWPVDSSDPYTAIDFKDGYMLLSPKSDVDGWRLANPLLSRPMMDFYLEMSVRPDTCSPNDQFGMIVRVPVLKQPDQGYLFGINCSGGYSLRVWDGKKEPKGEMKYLVEWTVHPSVLKGAGQTNRLGFMAVDNNLRLFMNGVLLRTIEDSTYPTGFFGVFVGSKAAQKPIIRIDEMALWETTFPK